MPKIDAPAKTQSRTGHEASPPQESYKDTLESVVVAFILAFVFRAFIIEAFVIPTGSMAATLNGEHWTHVCSDCGFQFAVGANRSNTGKLNNSSQLKCPNCSWTGDQIEIGTQTDNGDRILVFKWPLDFIPLSRSYLAPKRWDVTVFKDPSDGTTNFIKRLVGMPGEILEIIDGDIYTASLDSLPDSLARRIDELRDLKVRITDAASSASSNPRGVHQYAKLTENLSTELTPYQTILRKSQQAREALRQVIYDADHASRRAEAGTRQNPAPGWAPEPDARDWRVENRCLFFEGIDADRQQIRLENIRPNDEYGYNSALKRGLTAPGAPVSDLFLHAVLTPEEWDPDSQRGFVELILTKRQNEFRARFEPDGLVSLLRRNRADADAKPQVLCSAQTHPMQPARAHRIAIADVDYQITIHVDGKLVLATTDEMYAPEIAELKRLGGNSAKHRAPEATVAIAAAHIRARVAHILVERDIYYRNVTFHEGQGKNVWISQSGWGTLGNPIVLGDGEYFMLGDNSPQSKDSRLWWEIGPHLRNRDGYQLGTVPADQIIGRAFFVYWPGGYRAFWTLGRAIIPNVGRMRWIQ